MRVALCFSGMLRTHQKCLPTIIEHVIKANPEHEFHSFISTWDINGISKAWWDQTLDSTSVDFTELMKFKNDLNLKTLDVECYETSDVIKEHKRLLENEFADRGGPPCTPQNVLSMLYKIQRAASLSYEGARNLPGPDKWYDIVVKIRPDLFFTGKLEFQPIDDKLHQVFMPSHECWGPGALNDQLVYGNSFNMILHSHLYHKLFQGLYHRIRTLHPETLLHEYYKDMNIEVIRHPIPYHIER